MENKLLNEIMELHKSKNWKKVIDLNRNSDNKSALKVLWVWPSDTNLEFLNNALSEFNIQGVISLGCGCGLLEWIIQQFTGFPVIGYEINKEWWESKYSNPTFIPLRYVEDEADLNLDENYALLFCYFNNGEAFRNYIKNYRGNMVVVIGPTVGSGRHTDPQPFSVDFGDAGWNLIRFQEIKDTRDFITIYCRVL